MIRICFILSLIFSSGKMFSQHLKVNVYYVDKPQTEHSDTIYYTPGLKLNWSDFRGDPRMNSIAGAVTASGFAYNADMHFSVQKAEVNFYVYTFFLKQTSWKKPETKGEYHLKHEQTHFDITYLNCLDFIERLKKARFSLKNYSSAAEKLFEQSYGNNTKMQQKYDAETQHSIDKEMQDKWNRRIENLLSAYAAGK